MKFPVNFVIEINSEQELTAVREAEQSGDLSTLFGLLKKGTMRLADASRSARVLINSTSVAVGTPKDMLDRYKTECDMHLRSNVLYQEWIDGDYKTVRARRIQASQRRVL